MADRNFQLVSEFKPSGDQPQAIDQLVEGVRQKQGFQTLLGVTGSGKTFTMANVIQKLQRPTLVISHNKTLAAQLYEEFHELFPHNAVSYFVSYYDYYQPEAYIPQRDIYIEKDASRNDDLDRLRLAATTSLVSRRDVIIVASVSCIYGLGSPEEYKRQVLRVDKGKDCDRQDFLRHLSDLQYKRNDMDFKRGTFRVRGDVVEVHPAYEQFAYRIEWFGDQVDELQLVNPLTNEILAREEKLFIYPAVHYVMPEDRLERALTDIREELDKQVMHLRHQGRLLEAQRLLARTRYDIEMMREVGYCSGIENYSRHLDGRAAGQKPYVLLDYFAGHDWLLMIDESHATLPQLRAMYNGDQSRKRVLVEHGFRLPSALDNRPLTFEEFEAMVPQTVFVSATPSAYELEKCQGVVVEQVIRPTGLLDPEVEVRPAATQVPDLLKECAARAARGQRSLVNALTKRLAEDLAAFFAEKGLRCRYLHSEVETLDRVAILRELREGLYDVLVGVNLLREGLDLPEVALVCILDADKAGFLRSETSMIQQMGRAARNVDSRVILYADTITEAMQKAIDVTSHRRARQLAYNQEHGITPQTIRKAIRHGLELEVRGHQTAREAVAATEASYDVAELLVELNRDMLEAAEALDFETAAQIRDRIQSLETGAEKPAEAEKKPGAPGTRARKQRSRRR